MGRYILRLNKAAAILLVAILFAGCTGRNETVKKPASVVRESYFKTLLVIGDDRSGSTDDIRKLDEKDYTALAGAIAEKGGGTMAICLIGNPKPQSREPYILHLEPLKNIIPFDPRDTKISLSKRGAMRVENERILLENKKIVDSSGKEISDFISGRILPEVINYKHSGKDQTDIDDALRRINILINQPNFNDYEKIIIALVSDGINQPKQNIEPIKTQISSSRAEVYLIGWTGDKNFISSDKVFQLSEKSELVSNINNLKLQ